MKIRAEITKPNEVQIGTLSDFDTFILNGDLFIVTGTYGNSTSVLNLTEEYSDSYSNTVKVYPVEVEIVITKQ